MYQTSLSQFNELYEGAIDRSERASVPSRRIANIIDYMTYEIYLYIQVRACVGEGRGLQHGHTLQPLLSNTTSSRLSFTHAGYSCVRAVWLSILAPAKHNKQDDKRACPHETLIRLPQSCITPLPLPTSTKPYTSDALAPAQRGLFERHKLLFALMLANKILMAGGKIKPSDLDVLLKGGGALDIGSVRKKPKEWIPDSGGCARCLPDSLVDQGVQWHTTSGVYDCLLAQSQLSLPLHPLLQLSALAPPSHPLC